MSELEPAVSGPEFLEQILDTLKITKEAETWETPIKRIQKKLVNLDKKLGNSIVEYENLSKEISSLGTAYDIKFLFQTDMTLALEGNVLDKKIVGKVKQGLRFLNKWSKPSIKNTFI